jgi:hypothetical protein
MGAALLSVIQLQSAVWQEMHKNGRLSYRPHSHRPFLQVSGRQCDGDFFGFISSISALLIMLRPTIIFKSPLDQKHWRRDLRGVLRQNPVS